MDVEERAGVSEGMGAGAAKEAEIFEQQEADKEADRQAEEVGDGDSGECYAGSG
jgi:hypothetical protein